MRAARRRREKDSCREEALIVTCRRSYRGECRGVVEKFGIEPKGLQLGERAFSEVFVQVPQYDGFVAARQQFYGRRASGQIPV